MNMFQTRRRLVFGIALVILVLVVIYAIAQPGKPHKGLTLEQEVELTESERNYLQNRIQLSEAALQAQRKHDDVDLDLMLSLAWDYSAIGDLVSARELYEEYFEYNAINYTAWTNYAHVLRHMGDIQKAEDAYLKSVELSGEEADYRNYVTLLQGYFEEGERDEDILAALERGVQVVGQTPWFMVTLAEWYLEHGDCEKAFEHYEVAQDLATDNLAVVEDYNRAKEICTQAQ